MARQRAIGYGFGLALALAGALPGAVWAQADPGAYLAARASGQAADFELAAEYYMAALAGDPGNPVLLENGIAAMIGQGDPARAVPLAERLAAQGTDSQIAAMLLFSDAARRGDWDEVLARLDAGQSVGDLIDGLTRAWAHVGTGEMGLAIPAFDAVTNTPGLRALGLYHRALALASVGDFEAADAILSLSRADVMQRTRRATIAHAMVLSQLGRNPEAVSRIDSVFGSDPDPVLTDLRARLLAGDSVAFDLVRTPAEGVAELYYSVAAVVQDDSPAQFVVLHSRLAEWINPAHVEAALLSGALLDELGQHDLAVAAYGRIPAGDPAFFAAEMGRATALRKAGAPEQAAEVLAALAETHPDLPVVLSAYGDILRLLRRDREANAAYARALALYDPEDRTAWFTHYTKAITHHRLDEWPEAEAAFRRALELNPDQPQVLNYLGYSLIERGEKLEEALEMIERAVAAQPQNGAIVDSLGWALFRLGRYQEAVPHMERAAELEPVDPVVNDHLGDVYWAVGRLREARFQWARALSFDPAEAEADRVRRKLEIGLDAVLEQEGAPPLSVAQDG